MVCCVQPWDILYCNDYWITWCRGVISIISNLCKFLTPVMNRSDCRCLFSHSISTFLFHSCCNYSRRANCYLFRAACGQQRPASCNWMCNTCNIITIQPSSYDWYVHTQTSCRLPVYCAHVAIVMTELYHYTVHHILTNIQGYLCVKQWWICSENRVNSKMFLLPYNYCIFPANLLISWVRVHKSATLPTEL